MCRVEIRKPDGGVRKLAIPTVLDRSPAGFKFAGDAQNQLVGFLDLSAEILHLQSRLGKRYPQRT